MFVLYLENHEKFQTFRKYQMVEFAHGLKMLYSGITETHIIRRKNTKVICKVTHIETWLNLFFLSIYAFLSLCFVFIYM